MRYRNPSWFPIILLLGTVGNRAFPQTQETPIPDSVYQRAYRAIKANDYESAIAFFEQYLSLSPKITDSLKRGNALIGIGIANDKKGNYDEALKYYFLAFKAYETLHNDRKIAGTLKNIGSTYREFKNYGKSLDFLFQALGKMEALKDSAGMANIYNDIGITYLQWDSIPLSIRYLEKVAGPLRKFPADDIKAYAYNNLADAYDKAERYKDALRYYQSSLDLDEKMKDRFAVAIVEGNMGELYSKMGNPEEAIRHGKRGLDIAKELRSGFVLESLYGDLAEIYTRLKDYEDALESRSKQMEWKDSIFKEQSLKNYAEMDAKYQGEKRRQEIVSLQQKATINQLELKAQQRTRYFLLGVLLLALIIAGVLLRSYYVKRATNRQLSRLNRQLEEANQSKTKLFSILSHDLRTPVSSLFNFLQLRKNSAGLSPPSPTQLREEQIMRSADHLLETMEDLLIWSKSQMDSVAPFPEHISVSSLFEELIGLLRDTASVKNVQLTSNFEEGITVLADINFLRIVIRNLLGNAIKFTPAGGSVHLIAASENNQPVIIVNDNGPGIPGSSLPFLFDWTGARSDSSGLGLRLVKDFVDRMGATIMVSSGMHGTEFRITGLSR